MFRDILDGVVRMSPTVERDPAAAIESQYHDEIGQLTRELEALKLRAEISRTLAAADKDRAEATSSQALDQRDGSKRRS